MITNVLSQEGYDVYTSEDGKNIFELIHTHNIGVILLNIVLPDMNGFDILRDLMNNDITRDIPVIMVSGAGSALQVKKAMDEGAIDFIRKTSEPIEIIARVRSAFKLKEKHDQLLNSSQRDQLTQLYNKLYLYTALEKHISNIASFEAGVGLIVIDCDRFKSINDNYGHTFGDTVLASVANAITKSMKQRDTACRFGGEEFCVILPNVTRFQSFMIAERVRTNVEKVENEYEDKRVTVTVSCGVSHADAFNIKTGLQLVNEADTALYDAKRRGRNQTVLFDALASQNKGDRPE